MTEWEVLAAGAVALLLGGVLLQWRLLRRQRALSVMRPQLSAEAFVAEMAERGIDADVARAIRDLLRPWCTGGIDPHPEDALESFYGIEGEELEDLVEGLWTRFDLPEPSTRQPEHVPELARVADLGLWFDRRRRALSK